MIEKKSIAMMIVLASLCACMGQGVLPPRPTEVISIGADMVIESQDPVTGDVVVLYTLFIENVGDQPLEKVILKDFSPPSDLIMAEDYFEIYDLKPGERRAVNYKVTATGWGLDPKDQIWEVPFTIRIEEGSAYIEEEAFYYQVNIYPG
jgi:hypothetical protein